MAGTPKRTDEKEAVRRSIEAVTAAINSLSEADELRIRKYVNTAASRPDLKAQGITGTDLLHEAVVLALSGTRIWRPSAEVRFVSFLMGIVKSLVSHEIGKVRIRRRKTEKYSGDFPRPAVLSKPDAATEVSEVLMQVRSALAGDKQAQLYFVARTEGIPFSEMPAVLSLESKEVDAARQRVTRKLGKVFKGETEYDS
ncbi:MAG: sigma-70 family RNA polymerase sigma factor [Deltaproteobacteria bacterium]|nr:sigma-70 family RNA polymerase sigma factor [Deltaproteobacteria bacterium]